MNDRIDTSASDEALDEHLIADVSHHQLNILRNSPAMTGREIIQHNDVFTSAQKLEHRVTSDISGTTSDENSHVVSPKDPNIVERTRCPIT